MIAAGLLQSHKLASTLNFAKKSQYDINNDDDEEVGCLRRGSVALSSDYKLVETPEQLARVAAR